MGGNLAGPLIGIVTAPILAHVLGVEGRGQFAAATSPALLLTLAGTFGLPEAATYFVASTRLETRTALMRVVALSGVAGILLAGALALVAPSVSTGEAYVTRLITYSGLALPPTLIVGAIRGVAAGRGRWRLVSIEKYTNNGLRLVLVMAFALLGWLNLLTAVMIYLGCPVLGGIVYLPFVRAIWRSWRPGGPAKHGVNRLLLRYGGSTWVGSLAGIVLSRIDQVLLAPMSGARELGLYAAAVALGEIPYVLSSAARDVTLAADAAAADDLRAQRASRIALLGTAVLAGGLALLAPVLVTIAFGRDFKDAAVMVQLLLLAAVLYASGSTAGALLMSRGRPGIRSLSIAAACLLNILVLPILVPELGGVGAAWASVISYGFLSALTLVLARRMYGLPIISMLIPSRHDVELAHQVIVRLRARPSNGVQRGS